MSFKPTISLDGVAIIIALISFSVWVGSLNQRVNTNERQIETLTKSAQSLLENQTRLITLVEERTSKH